MPEPTEHWDTRAKCLDIEQSDEGPEVAESFGVANYTEVFFPERNAETYKHVAGYAKGVCTGKDGRPECPVRLECLRHAITTDERFGIWGGMSHRERNALVRKMARRARSA